MWLLNQTLVEFANAATAEVWYEDLHRHAEPLDTDLITYVLSSSNFGIWFVNGEGSSW